MTMVKKWYQMFALLLIQNNIQEKRSVGLNWINWLCYFRCNHLFDLLIDWLIDQLIDRSIHGLIDGSIVFYLVVSKMEGAVSQPHVQILASLTSLSEMKNVFSFVSVFVLSFYICISLPLSFFLGEFRRVPRGRWTPLRPHKYQDMT